MERGELNGGDQRREFSRLLVTKGDKVKAEWQAKTKPSFLVSVYLSQSCHYRLSFLMHSFLCFLQYLTFLLLF